MHTARTNSKAHCQNSRPPRYRSRQSIQHERKLPGEKTSQINDNSTQPNTVYSRLIYYAQDSAQIQSDNEKFSPHQNVVQILGVFQENFKKLLQIVPIKYEGLIHKCKYGYLHLKQVLTHYSVQNHSGPYYFQLHSQSTDIKNNLLKLLNEEKNQKNALKKQIQQIKNEIKKMAKIIKAKNDTCEDQSQKLRSLQEQNKQLQQNYHKNQMQIMKLRQKIIQKDEKLNQLNCNKQKMMQDLNQIQQQMKTLNFISDSQSNIGKSRKKFKSAKKLKAHKSHKVIGNTQKQGGVLQQKNQDLYRFLAIQAVTIQQNLFQQQDQ